jgi:hypothetical protein
VAMRVMHVRHVRVPMSHWLVLVRMRVRLAGVRGFVSVSVMDVMHVRMRMNESLVKMLMLVMFGQVRRSEAAAAFVIRCKSRC